MHLRRLSLLPHGWTQCPLDLLQTSKVEPGAKEHHEEVEDTVCPEYSIVQPFIFVEDVEPSRIFVTIGVLAEFTETIAAILNVATGLRDERGGIGLACLAWWRRESSEFGRGADDGAAVGGDRKEAFEEIVERRQIIHPCLPELRDVSATRDRGG